MEFLQGEVLVSSAFHKLLKISGGGSSLAASTEWIWTFIGVYRCGITETIDGLYPALLSRPDKNAFVQFKPAACKPNSSFLASLRARMEHPLIIWVIESSTMANGKSGVLS